MNKIKLDYLQPGCKILVVRFEGMLMTSDTVNNNSWDGPATRNSVWNIDSDNGME